MLDLSGLVWQLSVRSYEGRLGVVRSSGVCEGSKTNVACKGTTTLDPGTSYDLHRMEQNEGLRALWWDRVRFCRFAKRREFIFAQFAGLVVCVARLVGWDLGDDDVRMQG